MNYYSIESYRETIEAWANERKSEVFPNKGAEHAAVVLGAILRNANNQVRIYAKNMNGEISKYDDYFNGLKSFLNKENYSLKIFLDEIPQNESRAFNYLKSVFPGNNILEIKISTPEFRSAINKVLIDPKIKVHFALGDDDIIRLETDSNTHEAPFCSFNSPKTVNVLQKIFDLYFHQEKNILKT